MNELIQKTNTLLIPFILKVYETYKEHGYVPDYILHEWAGINDDIDFLTLVKIRDSVIDHYLSISA